MVRRGQLQACEGGVPVAQAGRVQRLAGRRRQQPDACFRGGARQFAEQRQGAAIRRAARVAGDQQARGRLAAQLLEQGAALAALVEDAGIGHAGRQRRRPGPAVVQFHRHQQGALAGGLGMAGLRLVQLRRCRIADTEALAGGQQAFAQAAIAGLLEVEVQVVQAVLPADQAQQGEQRARQQAVDHEHAEQPAGPGLPRRLAADHRLAAGAQQFQVRLRETEQCGQRAEGLDQGGEAVHRQQGGFPDEAVAAGGQQGQQQKQRGEQGEQPQAVAEQAQRPALQPGAAEQQGQRRAEQGAAAVARQAAAQPQPQATEGAAGCAAADEAQRPAEQGQQVQAEQAAQRPQQVDRARAIAQRGEGQPGAAEQRQPGEQQQAEAGALPPVLQGQVEAVAAGQQPGAGEDALAQIAAAGAG